MQVILHAGAHATDEDKLLRCLLRNADALRDRGVAVPGPSRYRQILSGALGALTKADPAPDARDIMLDTILDEDAENFDRLILSQDHLFCVPKIAIGAGLLYPKAHERLINAQRLFKDDTLELFIGLRNPATWLPAVFETTPHQDFQSFLNGADPAYLRWSELFERLQEHLPDLKITAWCNEDSPLIWGEIVRALAGLPSGAKINGAFDLLSRIMSPEGMQRFRGFLRDHPGIPEVQKRKAMLAFLDKYALEDEVDEEVDIAGWSDDYIDLLTDMYDADVERIVNMPNVTFIAP
ncbi:hypothetical protein Q4577_23010 [Marinovum sp. 2_MG-2023]|uniref:hypothetical protein n=1 Tax=unclassified Marinovum TaxID=2647166 RepID=UPI0026E3D456|nr:MULTISPECIES: hypothetical protein [unclassified Marinovum]MDO6732888.1 hypothetical protein [Marinovum sp. 2_MG-2023]MDO6782163.1 hypothetical protein [Marinovum sp. 1_MG-2023]